MNSSAPTVKIRVSPIPCHPASSGVEVSKGTDKQNLKDPPAPRQNRPAPFPGSVQRNRSRDNQETSRENTQGQQRIG